VPENIVIQNHDGNFNFDPYRFDKNFFVEVSDSENLECGGAAVFKIVAENLPDKYIVLFNAHNGYYAHGFDVKHGGITIRSGAL